ncbi:MAG: hypothetical protein OES57_08190 [Acidimicrobiia bacterium]|nr:hypothetical protein [Acidimicrobiia bacterium]
MPVSADRAPESADVWVAPTALEPPHTLERDARWLEAKHLELEGSQASGHSLAARLRSNARIASELDEFFRLRAARHDELLETGFGREVDAQTALETLDDLRVELGAMASAQDELFVSGLGPELAEAGVHLIEWDELRPDEQEHLHAWFEQRIFPLLTPLAVDPGHPFPYISDLSLNLAVVLVDPADDRRHFARVKVPGSLDRFVGLPGGSRHVPLEQVIVAHLDRLFTGMAVVEHHPFRVTRDGGVSDEVSDSDSRRARAGRPVRLEIHHAMSDEVRGRLQRELQLDDESVYQRLAPLDLSWMDWVADFVDHERGDELGQPDLPSRPGSIRPMVAVIAAVVAVAIVVVMLVVVWKLFG